MSELTELQNCASALALVRRADGTFEDLGLCSYQHRNHYLNRVFAKTICPKRVCRIFMAHENLWTYLYTKASKFTQFTEKKVNGYKKLQVELDSLLTDLNRIPLTQDELRQQFELNSSNQIPEEN